MARPLMNRIAAGVRRADTSPHQPALPAGVSLDTATISAVNAARGVFEVDYPNDDDPITSVPPVQPYTALSNNQVGDVVQVLRVGDTVLGVLGRKTTPTPPVRFG